MKLKAHRRQFGLAPPVVAPMVLAVLCYNLALYKGHLMFFEDMTGSGNNEQDDKQHEQNVNSLEVFNTPKTVTSPGHRDVIPVGLRNPAPETDDPIYYKVNADNTVGPFKLTAKQFKSFKDTHSSQDLDELVNRRALRSATALSVKSEQFDTILDLLASGQKPTEAMVKRFLSGDLQRVIESERRGVR